MEFYQRFLELCEEKGVKPTNLLLSMNLSSSKGTAWKNGSLPSTEILIALSNEFNVSVDYLVGKSDVRNAVHESSLSEDEQMVVQMLRGGTPELRNAVEVLLGRGRRF